MILMACVDGRNGMAFNCRRQSRDRAVRADLLAEAGEALRSALRRLLWELLIWPDLQ